MILYYEAWLLCMQHETLEREQESLDNQTLRKKVMSATIVKVHMSKLLPTLL